MNQGFGKDFYRKGNSVKMFGPFAEPPDSENLKVAVLIPFPKISSYSKKGSQKGSSKVSCYVLTVKTGSQKALKALTSLNKESRHFSWAIIAFGVFALILPLAVTAFGAPEGYFSLAITAFRSYDRLGTMEKRSLDSLI